MMVGVEKSTFSPLYAALRTKLVALRKAAGLTQRDLAKRLRREPSFIARIEHGERRVDMLEFYWVCRALRVAPEKVAAEVMLAFAKQEKSKRHST